MSHNFRKIAVPAVLIPVILYASVLEAVPVTFRVRMSYQIELGVFDPGADFVDVAGSFNGWGTDPLTPLSDADGDSIYELTVGGFEAQEYIEFKFRINGQWDGSEEFPGVGNNRSFIVTGYGDTVSVWYNDMQPGGSGPGELHWWNDAVFYEVFVRSFYDSDGDGIGDLQGLTERLDYLNDGDPATGQDLGVTGIWLMPIHDSPSYHGYDAVDYYSINPDYGTMADFEHFLSEAHERGIRVIIDLVMNHCSSEHPWFVASRQNDPYYRDWFRWAGEDPGQTGPWGQQVWHRYGPDWYYGLFWSGMPDLDYSNQAVKDEMFAAAGYWLDTVGVDGFRLDAVLYIHEEGDQLQNTASTLQFWADYNSHVKSVRPDAFSVGEAWTSTGVALQYVTGERLDTCFEFDLSYAILGAVNGGDAGWLGTKAAQVYSLYPYLQFCTFLTNHDQDRVQDVLGLDGGKARVAAGIYLTLPGVPFIYYGEEIGMTGSGAHEDIRTPMQWSGSGEAGFTTGTPWYPVNDDYTIYNVEDEQQDPGSLLNWYRRLISVRSGSPALRRGTHVALSSSVQAVAAYLREYEGEKVLCLANTASNPFASISLGGPDGSLVAGSHSLANLLVEGDTLEITVDEAGEITGLSLDGHETAIYRFVAGDLTGEAATPGARLRLGQNYPNPFNPSTTISFELPADSHVNLSVYDVKGRLVDTVIDETLPGGRAEIVWEGRDMAGRPLSSGVYFYRLKTGGRVLSRKMVQVR